MNEIFSTLILVLIFIVFVSVTAFYLIPKFDSVLKALVGSILIPYFTLLIMQVALFFDKIVMRIKFTHQNPMKIILSFITESFTFAYLGFGIWVISLVIFLVWYIKKRNENRKE